MDSKRTSKVRLHYQQGKKLTNSWPRFHHRADQEYWPKTEAALPNGEHCAPPTRKIEFYLECKKSGLLAVFGLYLTSVGPVWPLLGLKLWFSGSSTRWLRSLTRIWTRCLRSRIMINGIVCWSGMRLSEFRSWIPTRRSPKSSILFWPTRIWWDCIARAWPSTPLTRWRRTARTLPRRRRLGRRAWACSRGCLGPAQ